jgi:hypothetical protein
MGDGTSYSNVSSSRSRKFYLLIHFHRLSGGPNEPIPTFAPAVCNFRQDNSVALSVTDRDISRWRANPRELVGKCFTTTENIMRRTFLVQDYYVKSSGQARYEVVFEDTGLGVLSLLDRKTMLTMVKDARINLVL